MTFRIVNYFDYYFTDVSDNDLLEISQKLFDLAKEDFQIDYSINFGGQVNVGSNSDKSPEKLLQKVDEAQLESYESIKAFLPLMDNYDPDVLHAEDRSQEEISEEDNFIQVIMQTRIMRETSDFLTSKNVVQNSEAFEVKLKELWFELYDRDGTSATVLDSSGFEHVFVGESKNNEVSGTVFENHRKSLIQYCERSELHLHFEWTKVH